MRIDKNQISDIICRQLRGEALSEKEQLKLEMWLEASPENRQVFEDVQDETELAEYLSIVLDKKHNQEAYDLFKAKRSADPEITHKNGLSTPTQIDLNIARVTTNEKFTVVNHQPDTKVLRPEKKLSILTVWLRYAAAIVLISGIGYYFYLKSITENSIPAVTTSNSTEKDILPGTQKAVLTLSDGKKVSLNQTDKGVIEDGRLLISNNKGELTYENSDVMGFNTMSTPKGGQYRLTLQDGTKVWLNAASSISFPTSFPGIDRRVRITGEVYFEVVKNKSKPFIVNANGKPEIVVLGTHFNVNAYTDDNFKTSLLEGSIRIDRNILTPGQAYLNGKVVHTNLDQDVAWKNGIFNLHKMELKEVMTQLATWYDIDVVYEGDIPKTQFYGEMGRDLTLAQVLKGLEGSGIKFRIENGRRIIVKP